MSEYYVEVQFKCPNERVESVKGIIESSIRSSSTEETITSLSTLGDGIRELLEKVDSDGDRLWLDDCLLYTSPSPRDKRQSRMPSSA